MIATFLSRSGLQSASLYNKNLHSPYDPEKEAERFVHTRLASPPTTVLLLGPALNYISKLIRKRYSSVKIISIYYYRDFYTLDHDNSTAATFYTDEKNLSNFLYAHINEFDLEGLAVIEWPPSANIFPKISVMVNKVVKNFVEQLYAGFLTAGHFGRQWIKNSIKNYLFHQKVITNFSIKKPVLITASGPTLEESLPLIEKYEEKLFIAALPSSVEFLNEYGIHIDLVVTTDAGYYSSYHNEQVLKISTSMPLIAKSITSYFDSGLSHFPVHIFGSNDAYEAVFLRSIVENPCFIPSNGTVAGTAFDLILAKKPPCIIFAGLDFSYRDILSHARPHPFYTDFLSKTNRFVPFNSSLFSRYITFKATSKAFSTFAAWFNYRVPNLPIPVYRFNPSEVPVKGMIPLTGKSAEKLFLGSNYETEKQNCFKFTITKSEKQKQLIFLIEKWIMAIQNFLNKNKISSYEEFCNDPFLFALLRFSNPLLLKKIKKLYRLGDTNTADRLARDLNNETLDFLHKLLGWCE
jgi:hypothetical protein